MRGKIVTANRVLMYRQASAPSRITTAASVRSPMVTGEGWPCRRPEGLLSRNWTRARSTSQIQAIASRVRAVTA